MDNPFEGSWKREIAESVQGVPEKKDFTPPKWLIALCAAATSGVILYMMKPPFLYNRNTSKYMDEKSIHLPTFFLFGASVFLTVLVADSDAARSSLSKFFD